jgi:hypothetical protein
MSAAPAWIEHLDEADLQFVRRMVLASGSLKDLAAEYEVSYPTIRARLDRIIERIKLIEKNETAGPFEMRLRLMVADGRIEPRTGSELLKLHNQEKGSRK